MLVQIFGAELEVVIVIDLTSITYHMLHTRRVKTIKKYSLSLPLFDLFTSMHFTEAYHDAYQIPPFKKIIVYTFFLF